MDHLIGIFLFAVSSSVTPGPNNIMILTSGVNFGVWKSLPFLAGICVGFTLMLLLVGLGFYQLFELFPNLHFIVKSIGVLYLFYLAYLIAISAGTVKSKRQEIPFSFLKGALFQWVNAKAWIIATGATATFTTVGESFYSQILIIAATFLLVSFPCVGLWLVTGNLLKNLLNSVRIRKWFNRAMAALLVASIFPTFLEIAGRLI